MGFCLFNNVSIAANTVAEKGKKVLIFDHDVHHGNGTQDIFYDMDSIMYQSFHLYPHYPGTGAVNDIGIGDGKGYTINAPLERGSGDNAVLQLLDEIFLPIAHQFKPDLILISAGFDSHHADYLGGLMLSSNFFGEIVKKFQGIQPKIVLTLEGGYNLNWIGKCILSQLGQMISHPIVFDDFSEEYADANSIIKELRNTMGEYWAL